MKTVVLHGLCIDSDGNDASLVLSRVIPEPVPPFLFYDIDGIFAPAPPARPSALPPPGHLQLELTLTSKLGRGRVGHVYASDDSKTKISDPGALVHPLVVKVAGKDASLSADIAKEAWNYEEMECIQGVAVPRCYGLFQARLPKDGVQVKPWFEEDRNRFEITAQNDLVSVLVLERVGGRLTMPQKLSEEDK